jgi:AbiU2
MTTPSEQFERELEIFRTEVEAGTQFFYADLAVNEVAAEHGAVYKMLNETPLFWNTCLAALLTATFMALGRIFDQGSLHNIDRLVGIAQKNPDIFSKASLGRRRQRDGSEKPEWLDEFLLSAYEPTPKDFRRIRAHIRKRRRIYETNYQDVRHRVFAHRAVSDHAESATLFAKTNIRELQRIFAFLGSLYEALWQSFNNGRRPTLRPQRYSVKRIRALPAPGKWGQAVQEKITHEAEQFLLSASGVTRGRSIRKSKTPL